MTAGLRNVLPHAMRRVWPDFAAFVRSPCIFAIMCVVRFESNEAGTRNWLQPFDRFFSLSLPASTGILRVKATMGRG